MLVFYCFIFLGQFQNLPFAAAASAMPAPRRSPNLGGHGLRLLGPGVQDSGAGKGYLPSVPTAIRAQVSHPVVAAPGRGRTTLQGRGRARSHPKGWREGALLLLA